MAKRKKTVVEILDEPAQPEAILNIQEEKPDLITQKLNVKDKLQELMSNFQSYPPTSDRHPQRIENWIENYEQTRKQISQAIQEIP